MTVPLNVPARCRSALIPVTAPPSVTVTAVACAKPATSFQYSPISPAAADVIEAHFVLTWREAPHGVLAVGARHRRAREADPRREITVTRAPATGREAAVTVPETVPSFRTSDVVAGQRRSVVHQDTAGHVERRRLRPVAGLVVPAGLAGDADGHEPGEATDRVPPRGIGRRGQRPRAVAHLDDGSGIAVPALFVIRPEIDPPASSRALMLGTVVLGRHGDNLRVTELLGVVEPFGAQPRPGRLEVDVIRAGIGDAERIPSVSAGDGLEGAGDSPRRHPHAGDRSARGGDHRAGDRRSPGRAGR